MEQGEFYIPNSEIAKEAKAKVIVRANDISEDDIQDQHNMRLLPPGAKADYQALANIAQLTAAVNEIPELREFLNRGGRVPVTREYLPRRGRQRQRISLTSEGLVIGRVGKGGNEFPLTGNMIVAESRDNGAIEALGGLKSRELLERVARGIDPKTMRK